MSELDLDVLELYVKEAMGFAAETNDGVIFRARNAAAVLALIQRLREAEAERDWAIDQSKRASIQWNRDLQRIAQLEQVLTEIVYSPSAYISDIMRKIALASLEEPVKP
jgi:hypothetical protein